VIHLWKIGVLAIEKLVKRSRYSRVYLLNQLIWRGGLMVFVQSLDDLLS
jgi:hypothetical protein